MSWSKETVMAPFSEEAAPGLWGVTFREDVVLSRREALESCIEGIRLLMRAEEREEVMREILKPPQT